MLRYFSTYVQQNIVHTREFFLYSPCPMCVWGPLLFLSANLMICLLTTMTSIMQTWTAMAMIITTIVPESCCGSPILTTTITLKSEIYNVELWFDTLINYFKVAFSQHCSVFGGWLLWRCGLQDFSSQWFSCENGIHDFLSSCQVVHPIFVGVSSQSTNLTRAFLPNSDLWIKLNIQ